MGAPARRRRRAHDRGEYRFRGRSERILARAFAWAQPAGRGVSLRTISRPGFAGGLLEIMHRMPTLMILLAILGFSVGVEAGNQVVLLPLFGALKALDRSRLRHTLSRRMSPMLQRVASAGVSVAGLYYLGIGLLGS
jgi:hypothetical protein